MTSQTISTIVLLVVLAGVFIAVAILRKKSATTKEDEK